MKRFTQFARHPSSLLHETGIGHPERVDRMHAIQAELERRGLKKFRPVCYLTDEWGCPDQQPVLGIPFYGWDQAERYRSIFVH
jgi:hypothetical protein